MAVGKQRLLALFQHPFTGGNRHRGRRNHHRLMLHRGIVLHILGTLAGGLFALGNIAPLLPPRLNFGPEFVQLRTQTLGHTAPRKIKNPPHRHDDAQDAHHP